MIHDLTNRKSLLNLHKWLGEILFKEGNSKTPTPAFDGFDPEQFVGTTQVSFKYALIIYYTYREGLINKTETDRTP